MSNRLNPEKEEEVKGLLKIHSIREIVKKTGVAKNTIARIRNENLTEEEKVGLKKRANVKGRNKREPKKEERGDKEMVETLTKDCRKCGPKPIGEFTKCSTAPDGLDPLCRKCKSNYTKDRLKKKINGDKRDHRFKEIKKGRDYKAEYERRVGKAVSQPQVEILRKTGKQISDSEIGKRLLDLLHQKAKEISSVVEAHRLLKAEGFIRQDSTLPSPASLMEMYRINF